MSITFTDSPKVQSILDSLKKYKGKRVGVLLSGGLDSTLLTIMLLKVGAEVVPIRGEVDNTPNVRRERPARDKIIELLLGTTQLRKPRVISIDIRGSGPEQYRNGQMPYWMSVAMLASYDLDFVTVAYVAGDEECSFLSEMSRAFKASQFNLEPGLRTPKLVFPLHKQHKVTVVQALAGCEIDGLPVAPLISYCEEGGYRPGLNGYLPPCGKCPSCKKMENAIGGFSENTFVRYKLSDLKKLWSGDDELVMIKMSTHSCTNGFIGAKRPDGDIEYLMSTDQAYYNYRKSTLQYGSAWDEVDSTSVIKAIPKLLEWHGIDRKKLEELGLGPHLEKFDSELAKEAEIEANKKEEPCSEKQDSSEKNTEETTCLVMDTKA